MSESGIQFLTEAYAGQNYQAITDYIKNAAKNAGTESALQMMKSNDPFYVICALDSVAGSYANGGNYDLALLFGTAAYRCVYHYFFKPGVTRLQEMVYYAGSSAYYVSKSYLDTAAHQQGIDFFEMTQRDFNEIFSSPEFISLKLVAVDLFLQTSNPERAREVFNQISTSEIPYSSKINYGRLNTKLKTLFTDSSMLAEELVEQQSASKHAEIQGMLEALTGMLAQPGEAETDETKKIAEIIATIRAGIAEDGSAVETENAMGLYSSLLDYLQSAGGNEEVTLAGLRKQLQSFIPVLTDEATAQDKPLLQTTLQGLQDLLPRFEGKYLDETNDTLWFIQICQRRLEMFMEAAATLEKIRQNLEYKRTRISNKKERAGVFSTYKYLFPNLVELHYKSKNPHGVIKAIEASKGRLIADSFLQVAGKEDTDANGPVLDRLPGLLKKNNAAYLSFFMDDDYCISSLITANGKFYAGLVPIGRIIITQWVNDHLDDPKEWKGMGTKGLFSKKTDIPRLLQKFVEIIQIASTEGNISGNEHLVYSPDDMLFLFPLQYALLNEKPLIEQFTLSRIHSAGQLVNILEQPPAHHTSIVSCTVPAVQDVTDGGKMQRFSAVGNWLAQNTQNMITAKLETVSSLLDHDITDSILHFSTHGVFPAPGMEETKANPYFNSGLLLKEGSALPELSGDFDYSKQANFLNPKKLFESEKSWRNNHITFQACVSARSKEGVGGDALGMESAAFYCGASSMLTAGWNISIEWANKFCILFYNYWLIGKLSKAVAYQKAMLQLVNTEMPVSFPPAYYWAGMILSGDWR